MTDDPFDLATRAMELARAGQTREAEEFFLKALVRARGAHDDSEARFVEGRYADLLIHLERWDEAKLLLERSVEAGTDLPASFAMLFELYERQRDWPECDALLHRQYALETRQARGFGRSEPPAAGYVRTLANSGARSGDRDPIERALTWTKQLNDRDLLNEVL